MGSRLKSLHRSMTELWGRGRIVGAGNGKTGLSDEGRGPEGKPRAVPKARRGANHKVAKPMNPCRQEKPLLFMLCPYRRPTQVGGERIPRPAGEALLRNSAKWPRNFGRRGAWATRPQRNGPSNCLAKTQVYAKPQGEVYGLTPARCWKVKGRCQGTKHRAQAPVNGGRNYNGPKVAKFLVG